MTKIGTVRQNDWGVLLLTLTVKDQSGAAVNLPGAGATAAVIVLVRPGGASAVSRTGTIVADASGKVTGTFAMTTLDTAGTWRAQVQITFGSSGGLSSEEVFFDVQQKYAA